MMNSDNYKKNLLEIARRAGEAILDIYGKEDFQVEAKEDESPLTIADQTANKIICDALIDLYPEIPIISEENKLLDYHTRKDYELCWLVDPLDGTKEFIKRNGEFTVNIALVDRDEVIAGVVYAPVLDEMYYGSRGDGAFLITDKDNRIEANRITMKDQGLQVVCSRSHLSPETAAYMDRLNGPVKVSKGSSLKFLLLASGNADLYPRLAPTMEWDTAAAQIILEEAGGSVISEETGEKLKYNKENLRNPHFIAYANIQQ